MTLVAGIDIGNATTEVVLVDQRRPKDVVAHECARTRGFKGSSTSVHGAADLIRRLQRAGHEISELAVSSLRPVTTMTTHVEGEPPPLGPMQLVVQGSSTPANPGLGVGTSAVVSRAGMERATGAVVAVIPRGLRFDDAAPLLNEFVRRGGDLRAVVLEADEAVLLANRLHAGVPVVDEVDISNADRWGLVAVEVAIRGSVLTQVVDPLRLSSMFDVPVGEPALTSIVTRVSDVSSAVVAAVSCTRPEQRSRVPSWFGEEGLSVMAALEAFDSPKPQSRVKVRLSDGSVQAVNDLHGVDVHALVREAYCEILDIRRGSFAVAMLDARCPVDPSNELEQATGVLTRLVASETEAARVGALTTPGCSAESTVIDLGAGTIDVIGPAATRVLAGSGSLTTAVVALSLGIPTGLAEWVKRGPALWVDGPFKTISENGDRAFLDTPAPPSHVGRLVTQGPSGSVPFMTPLQVTQWRALRIAAKRASLGRGIARARDLVPRSGTAVVVGGPALDPELLMAIRNYLPDRLLIGRGHVAGELGPRYAAAYGLARIAATA